MTKEETINKAIEIEFGLGNTRSIREHNSSLVKIAEHVYDLLQPSLPSNLNEAAGKYLERPENNSTNQREDLMIYHAFIDGAEWMAEQGAIKCWMAKDKDGCLLISTHKPYKRYTGYLDTDSFKWISVSPRLSRELFPDIKLEDSPVEVTVQIRKKD